jgi:hypothetical protein
MNKISKNVGHSSFFVRNGRKYSKRNYQYLETIFSMLKPCTGA